MTSFRLLGIDCGRWGVLRLTRFRLRADDVVSEWLDPVSGPMTCFPSDSIPFQGPMSCFPSDSIPFQGPMKCFPSHSIPSQGPMRCFPSDSILSPIQSGVFHLTQFNQVFSIWLDPVSDSVKCFPSDLILSQARWGVVRLTRSSLRFNQVFFWLTWSCQRSSQVCSG